MTKIIGIDFVPLHVPLHRRLETLFCLLHILIFTFWHMFFIVVLTIFVFTPLWFVTAGYIIWWIYHNYIAKVPENGGCTSEWLRKGFHMRYFRDYFPVSLVKTHDLDPNKNYIIGSHPHGIVPAGAWCNFNSDATGWSEKFPGIHPHLMTLTANVRWPILREYLLLMGKKWQK